MTIQQKAEQYEKMFTSGTRQDGESYVFIPIEDVETEKLRESVKRAHGERLPDDWIYGTYADLMQKVTEYDLDTLDQLEDVRHEIVDGYVDLSTKDLTHWLHEDNNNISYLTEALAQEMESTDGFQLLAMAQYIAIDEVMNEVMDLLSK